MNKVSLLLCLTVLAADNGFAQEDTARNIDGLEGAQFHVYYFDGGYKHAETKENYDAAVEVMCSVHGGYSTIMILTNTNDRKAIRAFGFADRIGAMCRRYGVDLDHRGGETEKHEVHWHDGHYKRESFDSYSSAADYFNNDISNNKSKIIVRSKDLEIRDVYGFDDRIHLLKQFVKGQANGFIGRDETEEASDANAEK